MRFIVSPGIRANHARSKKGRPGRRRRLPGAPGRGTLAKEKPPVLGLIQRGGAVIRHMLPNLRQATIKPIITQAVAPGTLIHTDDYDIYARLPAWGYGHKTVCHAHCRVSLTAISHFEPFEWVACSLIDDKIPYNAIKIS